VVSHGFEIDLDIKIIKPQSRRSEELIIMKKLLAEGDFAAE